MKDNPKDMFNDMYERQVRFMEELKVHDKIPEWPLDMTSKQGQRLIKENVWNMVEELAEASYTLKNRNHRLTDARLYDREHYIEELGDSFAYFLEILVLSGISPQEFYEEYKRKNSLVSKRLKDGY